jgi:hypothetical protein
VGYHHGNHSTNFQFVEGVAGVSSNTGIIAPVADTNDEYVYVEPIHRSAKWRCESAQSIVQAAGPIVNLEVTIASSKWSLFS